MSNVKPRFLARRDILAVHGLGALIVGGVSLLARRRHHQDHRLFDRQDYVTHPFAQLEANGMPKRRLQKGENQMRVASPPMRRNNSRVEWPEWPNCCLREAGLDDRATQLPAVEPQTE